MYMLCLHVRQARLVSVVYRNNNIHLRNSVGSFADCNTHECKTNPLQYRCGNSYINCDSSIPTNHHSACTALKVKQSDQHSCELCVSHHKYNENTVQSYLDASLTPYSFSDKSKMSSTNEFHNLVFSQTIKTTHLLEEFLYYYNSKYGVNETTRENNCVENSKQTCTSKLPPTGNELDDMFGVEKNLNTNNKTNSELNEVKDDNFLYVTEMLNNYLHTAGECISSIFVAEKKDHSDNVTDNMFSSNEYLHNIENPLEAYACGLSASNFHENVRNPVDLNMFNYVTNSTGNKINETNQSIEKNPKQVVSSPEAVVYFSTEKNSTQNVPSKEDDKLPTKDQLLHLQDFLVDMVPIILSKMHEYKIYKPDLIFENNWVQEPYVSHGLVSYSIQLLKLRWRINIRYANVRVSVLKSTIHEDEGCVKIRWRMSGLPQGRVLQFWKFLPWNYKENLNQESVWYDGLSTLYVASSGHVYKHKVDRVVPDDEVAAVVEDKKVNLVEKLKKIATPPTPAPTLTR